MEPEQVSLWLSDARFQSYLDACDGDHARAVELYDWNVALSAAFLETQSRVEVLLRNAIDRQFGEARADDQLAIWRQEDWLCNESLIEDRGRERVNEAIERLVRTGVRPSHDRVVASLSFGFWCALFSGRYEPLWRSHIRHAFPNGNGRRRQVHECLQSILRFRNRVAHHEPIFSLRLERQKKRQLKIAGLIDEEAGDYIAARSRVDEILGAKP
jgi:hypothetical protein